MLFRFHAGDLSSASEDDNSDDDSDSRDLAGYHCRHCFSTSKSLQTKNLIADGPVANVYLFLYYE